MLQQSTQQSEDTQPAPCPAGLFDKIILAVAQEHEFKQTRKILLLFSCLLFASIVILPFSYTFFITQWRVSGIGYFIGTAMANMNVFFSMWQDFTLSIVESLPIAAIVLFAMNIALLVFTARLFLYKKGLLLHYLKHNFA